MLDLLLLFLFGLMLGATITLVGIAIVVGVRHWQETGTPIWRQFGEYKPPRKEN